MKPILALLAISLLTAAAPPSIDSMRAWQLRTGRVREIADRLLATNLEACTTTRNDFGMTTVSLNPDASAEVRAAWTEALHLVDGSNVVALSPGGPAQLEGIATGDVIVAVGDNRWSAEASARKAFVDALRQGEVDGKAVLTIRRGTDTRVVALQARAICDANVLLAVDRRGSNAWANGKTIVVEGGLEKLLPDDAELAFVIAHEAAHVFLGHSTDQAKNARSATPARLQMEIEADKLAVRLMDHAGYDPEAAARAQPKIDRANRGPFSRLFDIHGPYMSSKDRAAFLAAQAQLARQSSESR